MDFSSLKSQEHQYPVLLDWQNHKQSNDARIHDIYEELESDPDLSRGIISESEQDALLQELNDRSGFKNDETEQDTAAAQLETDKQLIPEFIDKQNLKVHHELGTLSLKLADVYSHDLADLKHKAIKELSDDHFKLERSRSSFEAKQDIIISFRVIFAQFSKEGSTFGYDYKNNRGNYFRWVPKIPKYYQALNFLNNVLEKAKILAPEVVYDADLTAETIRPVAEIFPQLLKSKEITWFGPNFKKTSVSSLDLEQKLKKCFETKKIRVQDGNAKNYSDDRHSFLKKLSSAIKKERLAYEQALKSVQKTTI